MTSSLNKILTVSALLFIITGCTGKSMVVLIPDQEGHVGQLVVTNDAGQCLLNQANDSVQIKKKTTPGKVKKLGDDEIRTVFADALAAQPLPIVRCILYFLPDSDELTEESKAELPRLIQTIQERKSPDVVVSGHTDTRGEKEYNYRLGLIRAQKTADILKANGVDPANIIVTSHGEGNPLVKTADETEEPKNRRVEVVVK